MLGPTPGHECASWTRWADPETSLHDLRYGTLWLADFVWVFEFPRRASQHFIEASRRRERVGRRPCISGSVAVHPQGNQQPGAGSSGAVFLWMAAS